MEEYEKTLQSNDKSFIPAIVQVANVATLPGIVGHSIALPDIHSGYGFAIGNVAAFDPALPNAVVSPGGVGFDINCGVRLLRTNLHKDLFDEQPRLQSQLAEKIFEKIPVGVGGCATCRLSASEIADLLEGGMAWAVDNQIATDEDAAFCEENGRLPVRTWKDVSEKAIKRGINQLGTLGAGNHYVEVQTVEKIFDETKAKAMGIHEIGQICVMIHCGSRGLGHQVASDFISEMEASHPALNGALIDRQLACAPIQSDVGQRYISAMGAAANFAFVNRSKITQLLREAFEEVIGENADDLDISVVYDVAHNVAKNEEHFVDGVYKNILVHRKGSTRAFGPSSTNIPAVYQGIGQPVLVGGSMGTSSYILMGTDAAMHQTFGSTCHGAGRAKSRHASRKIQTPSEVMQSLEEAGICVRVANPTLIVEEAPDSYKSVDDVVDVCHAAGISQKVVKLRPFCVIKG